MTEVPLRIVELPALRVAAARSFGIDPEVRAWAVLIEWARRRGLEPFSGRHRFFGFNDPSPSETQSEYGYQQWMTVDASVQAGEGDPVTIHDYPGGSFAVARCEGVGSIRARWLGLLASAERAGHHRRPVHELEELLNPEVEQMEEYVFDLYLPIED